MPKCPRDARAKDDVDNDDNDDGEEEEEEEELTIMLNFKLLQGKVSSLTDLPEINVQRGIRKDTIRASIGEFAFEGEVKPALGSIALFAKNNEQKSCSFVATVDTTADLDTLSKQTPTFAMLPLRIKPPQQQQHRAGFTDHTVGSPRNAN
ncbi:Hypothetical Protein FCC1311_061332 [Hondaea fermentalgiana]|uniref:Uncharacterized protein n=1 Tax=Hondaea fermentalgiana TaxID=2315210 RepID=A0A2R5GMQ5_9STRA|nr:Hypothetical Protein FCC1311_061332 [Hondaea fermentalgiana]|eukprot:GBG29913.1 Hypothetical Protein FCC1311_061332 [Hondaea fermentalgiana]